MSPIVFLHIPKTAGQTIHGELSRIVGQDAVSPVRVHTQTENGSRQFPPGYRLYSGHIDWSGLETLPEDRFVFTVLRDPRERIASFYFYLLKEARALTPDVLVTPQRYGMARILEWPAARYFFGGDARWRRFIRDHYDNVYTRYFATRQIRGWGAVAEAERTPPALLRRALDNLALVDRVYTTTTLGALEADIAARFGAQITVAGQYRNAGDMPQGTARWPRLMDLIDDPMDRARLSRFCATDDALLAALKLDGAAS
ncbi:MAG: sulfotransferase family 2 domain-containing protein [Dinoroseobacter sp.]|nr:sulfotransferase family 2 domain-containing protein [Dinoroseobacter sp.]